LRKTGERCRPIGPITIDQHTLQPAKSCRVHRTGQVNIFGASRIAVHCEGCGANECRLEPETARCRRNLLSEFQRRDGIEHVRPVDAASGPAGPVPGRAISDPAPCGARIATLGGRWRWDAVLADLSSWTSACGALLKRSRPVLWPHPRRIAPGHRGDHAAEQSRWTHEARRRAKRSRTMTCRNEFGLVPHS